MKIKEIQIDGFGVWTGLSGCIKRRDDAVLWPK